MSASAGTPQALVRRRVVVRGRVHGVGFRATTHAEAVRHGVAGWVRNCADGSVEAAFEGAPAAVATLVAFCQRGPRHAQVGELVVHEEAPEGLAGFTVR